MPTEGEIIHHRPFGRLVWDGYRWTFDLTLSSWAGFQDRRAVYGGLSGCDPSDGVVSGSLATEGSAPHRGQCAAYDFLVLHQQRVTEALLSEAFRYYRAGYKENFRMAISCAGRKEAKRMVPRLFRKIGLARVLGLHQVHFLPVDKDGVGYVGYEFGCNWDEEHGFGVLMYKDHIVSVGSASCSFDEWPARTHRDQPR